MNYDAGIHLTDFIQGHEDARKTINAWTEKKTERRIRELLPPRSLGPDTRFVLVNTVYFNAAWLREFAPVDVTFAAPSGERTVAGVGASGEHFRYASVEGARIVAVPYEGSELEFVAIVPDDLAVFEASLTGEVLEGLFERLTQTNVALTMPKIKIEGETIDLNAELSALGMAGIFGPSDFSGMTTGEKLEISDVFHQAFVAIDEKGTEAAAATAIDGRGGSSPAVDEPTPVHVDRPYLFFVRDLPTKALLFSGRVVDPSFE